MKAICTVLFLALLTISGSITATASLPESNKKPIEAVLEFYPNYAGHLLGVAQIGYTSSYADHYKESVRAKDLKYLKDHADLLQWSDGDEGILSYFFLTFPGYVNPASKTHLAEYLTDLNSAVAQKSFSDFKEKYKYYIQELELWTGFNENDLIFQYADEIQEFSKILMNNYDAFRENVWPEYESYLNRLANAMNEKFNEWNLIKRWERITGLEFKAPYYRVVLSTGMENGPTGKALGYEKDWYYFGENPLVMMQNICQEAGLRILSGLCSNQYEKYDPRLCFEVYKTLSCYLTDQILKDLGLGEKFQPTNTVDSELYSIFDMLWLANPDLQINQLYDLAVATANRSIWAMAN